MISPEPIETLARAICLQAGITPHQVQVLTGGQINQVLLVDGAYVLRLNAREEAGQRLLRESELLRSLEGQIPVPKIIACGQHAGLAYQIQQYLPGQKLYEVWQDLTPGAQDRLAAQLAETLKILHALRLPAFGTLAQPTPGCDSWADFVSGQFKATLDELHALNIRLVPEIIELALHYFEDHRHVLQAGVPARIHGDLNLGNMLVHDGQLSALLDFEFAMQAPIDYEVWLIEAFCLYPNDYAEEAHEHYCSADFASFLPLLRKHYPAMFAIEHLRERANLYHLAGAMRSYLAWRKANLSTIPAEKMAAKEFYMARLGNFISSHGARMFFA